MELYKGGRGARMQGSREKEKRKERKGQRRATPTTTSMGEGKATKRDDFFRILLPSNRPTLPPFSLSLFPPMLKGTTRRAEEEDWKVPRLKARLFSAPCRSRLISELKQAFGGQHPSLPPSLVRSSFVQRRKKKERRPSVGRISASPEYLSSREQEVGLCRSFVDEESRSEGNLARFFLGEKSRWMTIIVIATSQLRFPFDSPLEGFFDRRIWGRKWKESSARVKEIDRSIDSSRFSRELDWIGGSIEIIIILLYIHKIFYIAFSLKSKRNRRGSDDWNREISLETIER